MTQLTLSDVGLSAGLGLKSSFTMEREIQPKEDLHGSSEGLLALSEELLNSWKIHRFCGLSNYIFNGHGGQPTCRKAICRYYRGQWLD